MESDDQCPRMSAETSTAFDELFGAKMIAETAQVLFYFNMDILIFTFQSLGRFAMDDVASLFVLRFSEQLAVVSCVFSTQRCFVPDQDDWVME